MDYKSQIGQDKYFIENINKNKLNGFFVDVGAHNGITFSNTYCLEKHLNWNGLCIEVNDPIFEQLQENRSCICVNECVYSTSGLELEIEIPLSNAIPEGNDMLIQIKDQPVNEFAWRSQFITTNNIKKKSKTLTDIFEEHNVPNIINYMSIDIEGSDLDALKGIDFAKYTIEFLTIEWGGGRGKLPYLESIKQFLHSKGYSMHRINEFDAEFCNIPSMNSFDVFDTLLARKVSNPCDIFTIIEKTFPYPNFRHYRCYSQSISNGTFDDIYEKFKSIYNITDELCKSLKEFEIETEIKYSYLIDTNCNRVEDGDILISDMYLNAEHIMQILKANGFSKNVKIFVTPNGKGSGTIWPIIKQEYNIQLHLGDNAHADILMANRAGIKNEHTTIHAINKPEQFFINNNLSNFAFLLREFRHKNPYQINTIEYNLYNDQAEFNIPVLILSSNELYNIMKNENRKTLLLLTRDGCLL